MRLSLVQRLVLLDMARDGAIGVGGYTTKPESGFGTTRQTAEALMSRDLAKYVAGSGRARLELTPAGAARVATLTRSEPGWIAVGS